MKLNRRQGNIANLLLFQCGWLACVLFPGLVTAMIASGAVILHLRFISRKPSLEARFILVGTAAGSLVDGLWFQSGILTDSSGSMWTPPWLVTIWALFLTTLSHSLRWVDARSWLPWLLAPTAGPFAYWSASRLGAIQLPDPLLSLAALAASWLLLFPLLLLVRRHLYPGLSS